MKEYILRVSNNGSYRIYESYAGRQTRQLHIPLSLDLLALSKILGSLDKFPKSNAEYDYDAEEVTNDSYPDGIIADEFINPDGSIVNEEEKNGRES